jgi:PAS domain S-box-containing protein
MLMGENMSDNFCKILVADDDDDLLNLIQLTLEHEGLETEGVMTGAETIKRTIDNPPCLILLDYGLSDMTGKDVIESLNNNKINVPFIIMTGHGDEKVAVQMMKLGALDYLSKDQFFVDHLPSVVKQAVSMIKKGNGLHKTEKERKQTEENLARSNTEFITMFNSIPDAVVFTDKDHRIMMINSALRTIFGYSFEELHGNTTEILYYSKESREKQGKKLFHIGADPHKEPYRTEYLRKNGTVFTGETLGTTVRDSAGETIGFIGIIRDITKRIGIEEELKKHREHLMELVDERTHELKTSHERLENEIAEREFAEEQAKLMALFAELNPSPVLRCDIRGIVLMANPAANDIFASGSLVGAHLTSLLKDIGEIDLISCIRNGAIFSLTAQIGDRYFYFTFRGIPHLDIGHLYGSDITEQKKAEEETMRAAHLASLGELAAGVAHEINNPINGIINYTQILLNRSSDGSKEQDISRRIIKEGDRIANIVSSLLSFARNSEKDKCPVQIHKIISDSLALTGTQLKKDGINLKIDIPSDLPEVIAHHQQIEQVFLNIISNARYALSRKYTETHEDKTLDITAERIKVYSKPFIRITFHDRGIGIPAGIKNKVINPFFTTKQSTEGTGLGLSISHGIINDHGGNITIESVEGEFTKVIIDLPSELETGVEGE